MALRYAGERYPAEGVFDTVVITDGAGHYLKVPRLTTAQRDSLSPANGMIIFNTTTGQFERYEDGWGAFGGGDMYKSTYDSDNDGVVDNSERLEGSTKVEVQDHAAKRLRTGVDDDKPDSGNTEGDVWWATDTDKLYIYNGTDWQELTPGNSGATISFCDTQVFNDDSSATGYHFRTNGDTKNLAKSATDASMLGITYLTDGNMEYVLVKTDASGIIEWKAGGTRTTKISVIAYIKA